MSLRSTFSASLEQTYCCLRRAPSFLWSQLNEIAAFDSPAANICTGTDTRPNETVAEPMEWAAISGYHTPSCPPVGSPAPALGPRKTVTRLPHIGRSARSLRLPNLGGWSRSRG